MKADWKPITEPPHVPETTDRIPVLCVWEENPIPEVVLYDASHGWVDRYHSKYEQEELPYKWAHLPDTLNAFE